MQYSITKIRAPRGKDNFRNLYLKNGICLTNTFGNFCIFEENLKGMEQNEIWKGVEGHERYEVSNQGRLKRLAFSFLSGRWKEKHVQFNQECICNVRNYNERAIVSLDMKNIFLDVLVAKAFMGYGKGGYKKIVHKNGDPMDCRVENLQIGEKPHVCDDTNWQWERDELLKIYDIRRDGTVVRRSDGYVYHPCPNQKGYLGFRLSVPWSKHADGRKCYRIHRLVAMVYLPDYSPDLQVNHRNGVKTDNRAENLEMVTNSENAAHAWRNLDKETRSERMKTTRRTHKASRLACAVEGVK